MLRVSPGSLTAAHPPHHDKISHILPHCKYPMSPSPHPSVTSRELATVTISLGGCLPSSPGNLYNKALAQNNYSNGMVWGLERGESQVWQILGGN